MGRPTCGHPDRRDRVFSWRPAPEAQTALQPESVPRRFPLRENNLKIRHLKEGKDAPEARIAVCLIFLGRRHLNEYAMLKRYPRG